MNKKSDNFDYILYASRKTKKVTIPSFVKKIGDHAFNACHLTSIKFENNNDEFEIGSWSFAFNNFAEIFIPSFVKSIGNSVFYFCEN